MAGLRFVIYNGQADANVPYNGQVDYWAGNESTLKDWAPWYRQARHTPVHAVCAVR